MLFNSLQFAVFFVIVYSLYLALKHKWQNRMLLVASYVFYGAWDWRFLSLIFISTVLDYFCGIVIYESQDNKKRKLYLLFSMFGNLAMLGFFKYFDFFASNLQGLLEIFGFSIQPRFLHVILPVGISFYAFQTMSYTIDIYNKKMVPTKKFFDFALFVAFFPQLVAGPIERAKHLLPQILQSRKLDLNKFYEGCYLIFWGLFLKVFVADNMAKIVDLVFNSEPPYDGARVLLALYAFAFQIFGDFAGYSSIARGLGKLMGFDIMVNFNLPYFATNPSEFWKRWHISLSSWLRDYLYIPLGGSKKGTFITYRNLSITMLLGGLWHGAAWTFVVWGSYQAMLLIIYKLFQPFFEKTPLPKSLFAQKVWLTIRILFFFHLVCLGWLIFRAHSMTQVFEMLRSIFFNFRIVHDLGLRETSLKLVFYLWLLLLVHLFQYKKNDLLFILRSNTYIKVVYYYACLFLLVFYGVTAGKQFIYFQF